MTDSDNARDGATSRPEIERDVREWLEMQGYDAGQVETVLERIRGFDDRMLHDSFFASIGTGSLEFEAFIADALDQAQNATRELETVVARWQQLTPETRRAVGVLTGGKLPAATEQALVALLVSLAPEESQE